MKLHLVGLPHTAISSEFCGCAYTNKNRLFCKMMGDLHEIVLYAPESDPVPGATMVQCLSENARIAIFGKDDPNRLPLWPTDKQSLIFNLSTAAKILERADPHDPVLLAGGWTHKGIKDHIEHMLCIEPFVGYEGILTDRCAFESYAHMHTVYAQKGIKDIRWYDRVIPPFVDPDEFPHLNDRKGDYLLFLGRLISRKGPHIALQIAKATGLPLMVAGAGGTLDGEALVGNDGVRLEGHPIIYKGPVGVEERAKIMAGARALIVPTTYLEPGANVVIEAQMAGTPVVAPDWGVFSETVKHGVTGFHFRTLREGVEAVQCADILDPAEIRAYAQDRYSLKAIAPKFDRWFTSLQDLWGDGWAAL